MWLSNLGDESVKKEVSNIFFGLKEQLNFVNISDDGLCTKLFLFNVVSRYILHWSDKLVFVIVQFYKLAYT